MRPDYLKKTRKKKKRNSSSLFRDNNISTCCNRDQELALVHAKIFFNQHLHWHLVVHIALPAECKDTAASENKCTGHFL